MKRLLIIPSAGLLLYAGAKIDKLQVQYKYNLPGIPRLASPETVNIIMLAILIGIGIMIAITGTKKQKPKAERLFNKKKSYFYYRNVK